MLDNKDKPTPASTTSILLDMDTDQGVHEIKCDILDFKIYCVVIRIFCVLGIIGIVTSWVVLWKKHHTKANTMFPQQKNSHFRQRITSGVDVYVLAPTLSKHTMPKTNSKFLKMLVEIVDVYFDINFLSCVTVPLYIHAQINWHNWHCNSRERRIHTWSNTCIHVAQTKL